VHQEARRLVKWALAPRGEATGQVGRARAPGGDAELQVGRALAAGGDAGLQAGRARYRCQPWAVAVPGLGRSCSMQAPMQVPLAPMQVVNGVVQRPSVLVQLPNLAMQPMPDLIPPMPDLKPPMPRRRCSASSFHGCHFHDFHFRGHAVKINFTEVARRGVEATLASFRTMPGHLDRGDHRDRRGRQAGASGRRAGSHRIAQRGTASIHAGLGANHCQERWGRRLRRRRQRPPCRQPRGRPAWRRQHRYHRLALRQVRRERRRGRRLRHWCQRPSGQQPLCRTASTASTAAALGLSAGPASASAGQAAPWR